MRTKSIGRLLRASAPTARLLTEYRVATITRTDLYADLAQCTRWATPGSTAIDVGASVGNYALALSKAVGRGGRVLALEANPAVFRELVNSTWGSRVTALNLAASRSAGWAQLVVPRTGDEVHEPLATLEARPGTEGRSVEVRCVRLDDVVDGSRQVSLVKIDVEGHESEVLAGAEETIERHHPTFVIEIEQRHLVDRQVRDVAQVLLDRGYTCCGIQGRRLVPWDEFDVAVHQTSWLARTDAYRAAHPGEYVNNFLFRPLS